MRKAEVCASNWRMGWNDIIQGIMLWRIWLMLAWQDIRMRYRRSVLGPLWITASTAVMIYSMGFLYSHLFNHPLNSYLPLLACGIIIWNLLSSIIRESNEALIEATPLLHQRKLPYTLFLFRLLVRNFIIFAHNLIAVIPAFILCPVPVNGATLFLLISMSLVFINGYTYGAIIFLLGSRFRDTKQLFDSLIQVAFFLTPVIWDAASFPQKYHFLLYLNPFAQFVELCRMPMLGQLPSAHTVLIVLGYTLIGPLLMLPLFFTYRKNIIYWL